MIMIASKKITATAIAVLLCAAGATAAELGGLKMSNTGKGSTFGGELYGNKSAFSWNKNARKDGTPVSLVKTLWNHTFGLVMNVLFLPYNYITGKAGYHKFGQVKSGMLGQYEEGTQVGERNVRKRVFSGQASATNRWGATTGDYLYLGGGIVAQVAVFAGIWYFWDTICSYIPEGIKSPIRSAYNTVGGYVGLSPIEDNGTERAADLQVDENGNPVDENGNLVDVENTTKKPWNWWIWGPVILFVVVAIAGAVYFFVFMGNDEFSDEPDLEAGGR